MKKILFSRLLLVILLSVQQAEAGIGQYISISGKKYFMEITEKSPTYTMLRLRPVTPVFDQGEIQYKEHPVFEKLFKKGKEQLIEAPFDVLRDELNKCAKISSKDENKKCLEDTLRLSTPKSRPDYLH